jgi:hypothetical protein
MSRKPHPKEFRNVAPKPITERGRALLDVSTRYGICRIAQKKPATWGGQKAAGAASGRFESIVALIGSRRTSVLTAKLQR